MEAQGVDPGAKAYHGREDLSKKKRGERERKRVIGGSNRSQHGGHPFAEKRKKGWKTRAISKGKEEGVGFGVGYGQKKRKGRSIFTQERGVVYSAAGKTFTMSGGGEKT